MKSLKHFCLSMVHVFTFLSLMHMHSLMNDAPQNYTDFQLWFVSALAVINLGLMFFYMGKMMRAFETKLPATEGWDGD